MAQVHTQVLCKHLQALPQEIHDMIFEATFAILPAFRMITKSEKATTIRHQPPNLMAVNRATRAKVARQYYSQSIFVFAQPYDCYDWARSISPEYVKLLKDVRYLVPAREYQMGMSDVVKLFWKNVLTARVDAHVAGVLRIQTREELEGESEGCLMLNEWEA